MTPDTLRFDALPIAPVLAALLSAATIAWLLHSGKAAVALDHPNERSLHDRPVPRVGGVGIVAGALPALLLSGLSVWFALLVLFLAVVSFLDDRKGLPVVVRFGAHLFAALAFCAAVTADLPPWLWPLLAIGIGWLTNLYNFMDGSDGLAGGMAVIGFGAFAAAAWLAQDDRVFVAALSVASAAAAFLVFNFHPARVFMGDAGSIPLGFLAGAMGVYGWHRGLWPGWFPPLAFLPFVADASVTLVRRMLRGERVWQAHRSHYYQRLVRLGWGHRRTALAEYALMLFCAAGGVCAALLAGPGRAAVVASIAVVTIGCALWVDSAWRRHALATGDAA